MENAEIARVLSEIADLLELTGGNPFKVRAYRRAAQVIDVHPSPVAPLWRRRLPSRAGRVPVVITSDAHEASQLENLRHGVWVARRGWLEAKDVLNTLPPDELQRRLRRRTARTRTRTATTTP